MEARLRLKRGKKGREKDKRESNIEREINGLKKIVCKKMVKIERDRWKWFESEGIEKYYY